MKTWFNRAISYPVESIPPDYGKIEAQKVIHDLFNNLDDDSEVDYNSEFIEEMNKIEKEEPFTVVKQEDLFGNYSSRH